MQKNEVEKIAALIDHAVLGPAAGRDALEINCRLAAKYNVASVCVKPCDVSEAKKLLAGTGVMVGTVIGFPHGNSHIDVKVFETEVAVRDGAEEIDMVINVARALEGDWEYLEKEISAILHVTTASNVLLKVIFENGLLANAAQKIRLCGICSKLNVGYVKTSTGFGYVKGPGGELFPTGATPEDIALMRQHTEKHIGVKASGGIKTLDDLLRMYELGAGRIGTSSTEEIMNEANLRYRD